MRLIIFLVLTFTTKGLHCIAQVDTTEKRGLKLRMNTQADSAYKPYYKNSYALIIGVSNYQNSWSQLPGASNDADSMEKVLRKHDFKVTVLKDPGLPSDLQISLNSFLKIADSDRDNRIVIYYAGHGHADKTGTYLIMDKGDASLTIEGTVPLDKWKDRTAENSSFYNIKNLFDQFRAFNHAKHLLLILDGCFLGQASDYIIRPLSNEPPPMIKQYLSTPGRYLLTASTRDQSVPDKSIFCNFIIKGINGEADLFKDGYITLSELKVYLQNNIGNQSGGKQIIFMGQLLNAEQLSKLDKSFGELVFINPNH